MASTGVYLNVQDAKRSIDLYTQLGFEVTEEHEAENGRLQFVGLEMDGAELSLGEVAANPDPEFQAWMDGEVGRGVITYFTVPDAEAIFEKAKAAGAEIEMPLNEHTGTPSFTLVDPDGYTVSFFQS